MTLKEIIKIIGGKSNISDNLQVNEIKTDTRKINKGDIFIALNGKKYDGHNFINVAIEKGAVACIVEKLENNRYSNKCIVVDNTYQSLFDLGNYIRNKHNIPLIAITGSNGKTTTKDLVAYILSSKYNVLKNEGSKNNLIGVSETLFKLNNDYEVIVMELGTNHMGEINTLSLMCNPTTSIITNIGSSHLEYFKKRKNILKEKKCITNGMFNKELILNGDDRYLKKLKGYKCGKNRYNDLVAYNINENLNSISFCIKLDKEYKIVFNNPGKHFINDILLSIKTCLLYNIKIDTIIKKINSFKLTDKRMNLLRVDSNTIVNDCYNSSYESIHAGLDYIKKVPGNKILIIGDILELGDYSIKIHKRINRLVKKIKNCKVFTVGIYTDYIRGLHFKNPDDLIQYIKKNPIRNSYIYVKGSRRVGLDKVVDYLVNIVE